MAEPPSPDLEATWREHRYRRLIPMTHEQYLNEPAEVIEWALALDSMEQEVSPSE